jgi:hypothetical protein
MVTLLSKYVNNLRKDRRAQRSAARPGDLFFTNFVENIESLLYIGHYPGTRTHVHPHERHEDPS